MQLEVRQQLKPIELFATVQHSLQDVLRHIMDQRDCVPIPGPPGVPILGNLLDLRHEVPFQALYDMIDKYGEICSLKVVNLKFIIIGSHAMLNELCDERRFRKDVHPPLRELRALVHDGLFTAYDHEQNWRTAHTTLTPAFGPLKVDGMFEPMKDIASQLILKWLRHGPSYHINAAEDFTRLTLDTIALCAMNHRFNSFYTDISHPFILAMGFNLAYTDFRAWVPRVARSILVRGKEKLYRDNNEYMRGIARDIVRERSENPRPELNDLLNAMLNGKDPKTGLKLDDESIVDNMLTFLIAGHETTSGMLSFTLYYLLKNKDAYKKVQDEVDSVVGTEDVQLEHLRKLPYINAVLRESSRLASTAPAFAFTPKSAAGEILGGKHHIPHGMTVMALLWSIHRDKAVFGEDADEFKPERMLDENFNKLPENAWKTFGNGARGCIGKGFAWQEMLLVMVMIFQHFDFEFANPDYELLIDFTLTVKPLDLYFKAIPRAHVETASTSFTNLLRKKSVDAPVSTAPLDESGGQPLLVLYGSNSGTCELLARTLASSALAHGFRASAVKALDDAVEELPEDQPIIIVTASYEGHPTDNAVKFCGWLEDLPSDVKIKTDYAIFGCGHSDWRQTFHKIPKTMDKDLEQHGGQRLCATGLADAAKGDMLSEFQTWEDTVLWPALQARYGTTDSFGAVQADTITVDVTKSRASHLRSDAMEARVLEVRTLTAPDEKQQKKHIILELPEGSTYRAGDYCAILPFNPPETVRRVMTRFALPYDTVLQLDSAGTTSLPTKQPISALDLFGAYLELSQPATRRNIAMLIDASSDAETVGALKLLSSDDFNVMVTEKRVSLLDLLERYPNINLKLSSFVTSLIPMRTRQYSVASSPLKDPRRVTLVYDVLDGQSTGGQARHIGVASNYLSSLRPGNVIHATMKPSHQPFHLPNEESKPVIMIAAGAGLAPFVGFIEERAALIAAGKVLAPAHLFFGCRQPGKDDLYAEEMTQWQQQGVVTVHNAYSRTPELSQGHRHIDETLLAERKLLIELWEQDALVYVCGSRAVGESVKRAFLNVASDMARDRGEDDAESAMQRWFEGIRNQRYTTDVFT